GFSGPWSYSYHVASPLLCSWYTMLLSDTTKISLKKVTNLYKDYHILNRN
ncbi:unnamed protein product, partial [Brassica rapa subsp. trilocularis]